MAKFSGKVAIVAGAGGIGSASACRLANEGCAVLIGDISERAACDVAERISGAGGKAVAQCYDQSDELLTAQLVASAIEAFGRLDFVHANVADTQALRNDTDAMDIDLSVFDRTISVNLRGNLVLTRHALPHLIENKGAIVYSSSGAAYAGEATRLAYGITKSALNALVRHVATRWGRNGVRSNAICPGLVLTEQIVSHLTPEWEKEMMRGCRSPRLGHPEDIAAMVAYLMSDDAVWINGQCISVDGGMTMRA